MQPFCVQGGKKTFTDIYLKKNSLPYKCKISLQFVNINLTCVKQTVCLILSKIDIIVKNVLVICTNCYVPVQVLKALKFAINV